MENLLDLMMEEKPIFEKAVSKSISPTRRIRDSVPEIPFFQNTRNRLKRAMQRANEYDEKVHPKPKPILKENLIQKSRRLRAERCLSSRKN